MKRIVVSACLILLVLGLGTICLRYPDWGYEARAVFESWEQAESGHQNVYYAEVVKKWSLLPGPETRRDVISIVEFSNLLLDRNVGRPRFDDSARRRRWDLP